MSIKCEKTNTATPKEVHVTELKNIKKDDNRLVIFAITGMDFDADRLLNLISNEFNCSSTYCTYTGVLTSNRVKFETWFDKFVRFFSKKRI